MKKTVIVTIHGIMTDVKDKDDWQERFDRWLHLKYGDEMQNEELVHRPFSLGWINPIRAHLTTVLYWLRLDHYPRRWSIDKFRKFLEETQSQYPDHNIHIVAHSFGTWVTHEVLRMAPNIRVQSLNFFGAVISAHIRRNCIDELVETGQLKACFNWCSHNDIVVRHIAIPPFGHLGYWGFLRPKHEEDRVKPKQKPFPELEIYNYLTEYGHSDYFIPEVFEYILVHIGESNGL